MLLRTLLLLMFITASSLSAEEMLGVLVTRDSKKVQIRDSEGKVHRFEMMATSKIDPACKLGKPVRAEYQVLTVRPPAGYQGETQANRLDKLTPSKTLIPDKVPSLRPQP